MHRFEVSGMCGDHCASTVTQALVALDPKAAVVIDVAAGTVAVDSAMTADSLLGAIRKAGYGADQPSQCCGSCAA